MLLWASITFSHQECHNYEAKVIVDWQIKEHMRDSFVHIVKELQGNDSISQAPIELNKPLHSNWANLLELVNQPIISKKPV